MSSTYPSSTAPLEPGQRLGRYEVRRLVGRGSVTATYRAFSPELQADVALKVISHRFLSQADAAASQHRFHQELQAAASLYHPNIARIFDYGVAENVYYVAMELIDGPSLRDLLSESRRGLPQDQALQIFRQVADAVGYAHSRGVIHQDIRPGNVLMAGGIRPVVVDFGLIRVLGDDEMTTAQFSPRAPIYMSPEQASGQEVTPSADVYSLGVLLYEMVTGDVPFKGSSAARIMVRHIQEAPRPPSHLAVGLDPRVEAVIMQALAKDPAERPASPRSMIEALEREINAEDFETITLPKDEVREFQQRARAAQDAAQGAAQGAEDEQEPGGLGGFFRKITRRLKPPDES